ncbi:hypothetical protein TRVL_06652 [Trypanosoma vivax]|nr:hypothetical protein TRVL_06652 [Trypanosoma vivax]
MLHFTASLPPFVRMSRFGRAALLSATDLHTSHGFSPAPPAVFPTEAPFSPLCLLLHFIALPPFHQLKSHSSVSSPARPVLHFPLTEPRFKPFFVHTPSLRHRLFLIPHVFTTSLPSHYARNIESNLNICCFIPRLPFAPSPRSQSTNSSSHSPLPSIHSSRLLFLCAFRLPDDNSKPDLG